MPPVRLDFIQQAGAAFFMRQMDLLFLRQIKALADVKNGDVSCETFERIF
jgi:hypothetical protein